MAWLAAVVLPNDPFEYTLNRSRVTGNCCVHAGVSQTMVVGFTVTPSPRSTRCPSLDHLPDLRRSDPLELCPVEQGLDGEGLLVCFHLSVRRRRLD